MNEAVPGAGSALDPTWLSASAASRLIASGQLSSLELVRACLDQISSREATVRAFAHVDADGALREAARRDAMPAVGPLHGVPVAVKDVIEVAGMPCGMGSPIYDHFVPFADAACVAALRAAGAVIIGKTVTAEFAGVTPGPTTNPLAPDRTPGGSSSGSAAALASGMVPIALGTQTGGSILRPASFCGVFGFKPSFGTISRAGLKLAAEGLDTIGVLAREIVDVALSFSVLVGRKPIDLAARSSPPRLLLYQGHHWSRATADTVAAVQVTADRFRASGAQIDELPTPPGIEQLSEARAVINAYERARSLAWEWQHHAGQISPRMSQVLAQGSALSFNKYLEAMSVAAHWRAWFANVMQAYDGVLTASANGEAPRGLGSTGDAAFQEIWTIFQLPSISLPLCTGQSGLPVGVQLVGHARADEALLNLAAWAVEKASSRPRSPASR